MNKILTGVIAASMVLSFVAPVAAGAQTMTATSFHTNLTIGSTGSDVVALQSWLVAKGYLVIPAGTSMGYFGNLTKNALAAYQSAKGISPAVGFFGPITQAAVNAEAAVGGSVATCPAGYTCTSTTPTTGVTCPAGFTCTSTNGGTVTSSTEGSLDVKLSATPTNNANVQTNTDVPVYGLDFTAKIAPVTIQTVDLQLAVYNQTSSSYENPATLINTIKVWDGSNVIATIPVTSTSITKDQNQVYYVRLSGLNYVVPVGTTKTLTFSFSTNSIDTNRTVTIDGYNSSSVRATSGNNVSSFYSIDGSAYTRTHTFKKPGTSSLTLSAASSPLRSQNYRVNTTNTTIAPVLNFNVKSDTGDSQILTVNASSTLLGVNGSDLTYYLYDGSTLLSSQNGVTGSSTVTFNNLTDIVSQDTTKTLSIKIGFPATSTTGAAQIATTSVTSVVYQTPNGSSVTVATAVNGVGQYVYPAAPQFVLASAPSISSGNANQSGSSTSLTATFAFNVTSLGGQLTKPTNSDFVVVFGTSTTQSYAASSVNVVTIPNNDISDGSTASVTVTAQIPASSVPASGLYNAAITSIAWHENGGTVTQTYGLDDFKTSAAANFIK